MKMNIFILYYPNQNISADQMTGHSIPSVKLTSREKSEWCDFHWSVHFLEDDSCIIVVLRPSVNNIIFNNLIGIVLKQSIINLSLIMSKVSRLNLM